MADDTQGLRVLLQTGHRGKILDAVILPEVKLVVSLDAEGTLITWHIETGKQLQAVTLHGPWSEPDRIPADKKHLFLPDRLAIKHEKLWIYGKGSVFQFPKPTFQGIDIKSGLVWQFLPLKRSQEPPHAFSDPDLFWEINGNFDEGLRYYYLYFIHGDRDRGLYPVSRRYDLEEQGTKPQLWFSDENFDHTAHYKKACIFDHAHGKEFHVAIYNKSILSLGRSFDNEYRLSGYSFFDTYYSLDEKDARPKLNLKLARFKSASDAAERKPAKIKSTHACWWVSPKGDSAYWVGKNSIRRMELASWKKEAFAKGLGLGETGTVYSLNGSASLFTEEGRYLGLVYKNDKEETWLHAYDTRTRERLFSRKLPGEHHVLSFGDDGKYLTTVERSSGVIHLWKVKEPGKEGYLKRKFFANMSKIHRLGLQHSSVGPEKLLLTTTTGSVYSLELKDGLRLRPVQTRRWNQPWLASSGAVSHFERLSATDGNTSVQIINRGWKATILRREKDGAGWIRRSPEFPEKTHNRIRQMHLSANGRYVAVLMKNTAGSIFIYNTSRFTEKKIKPEFRLKRKNLLGFALHPNKRMFLAAYSFNRVLRLEIHQWVEDGGGLKAVIPFRDSQPGDEVSVSFSQSGDFFFFRGEKQFEIFRVPDFPDQTRQGAISLAQLFPGLRGKNTGSRIVPSLLNGLFPVVPDQVQFVKNDGHLLLGWHTEGKVEVWDWKRLNELVQKHKGAREKILNELAHSNEEGICISLELPELRFRYNQVIGLNSHPLLFFTGKNEEPVTIINWQTKTTVGSLYLVNDRKFILIDPNYNYYTTPDGHDLVAFAFQNSVYELGQFDLVLNRPHKILERLGLFPELIEDYQAAFSRRLHDAFQWSTHKEKIIEVLKNKLTSLDAKLEKQTDPEAKDEIFMEFVEGLNLPEIAGLEDIQVEEGGKLSFRLKATGHGAKLDRLYVVVNGVPANAIASDIFRTPGTFQLQGRGGLSIPESAPSATEFVATIKLDLSDGENVVEFSVLNETGGESLRKLFYVQQEPSAIKPDLYLIIIGVNQYDDADATDLNFAVQDAKCIAAEFLKMKAYYQNIKVWQFINERPSVTEEGNIRVETLLPTKAAITAVLSTLEEDMGSASVNDRVVFTYSGHGKVEGLEYYLGAQDTDFSALETTGFPYKSIEYFFDFCPPRNKLAILDACFSGRIDELSREELQLEQTSETGQVVVVPDFFNFPDDTGKTASDTKDETGHSIIHAIHPSHDIPATPDISVAKENSDGVGPDILQSPAFLKMQELFVDIRRGAGATVFSASSGDEKARENLDWKHGALTLCLLSGLEFLSKEEGKVILGGRQEILLSGLSDFLIRNMPRITAAQKAEIRMENISNNWVLGKQEP